MESFNIIEILYVELEFHIFVLISKHCINPSKTLNRILTRVKSIPKHITLIKNTKPC